MKRQSLLLIIPVFLIGLAFADPVYTDSDHEVLEQDEPKAHSYLALGDSYTIGESVDENDRWPVQLAKALNNKDMIVEDPMIIAKTGWRTDDMLGAAQAKLDSTEQFDMVSLLIGVNNEYQQWKPADFEPEFVKCLNYAISKSRTGKKGVFVVSIPDYGYTPFGAPNKNKISKRLTQWNSICEETCKAYDIPFYNITPISQSDPTDESLVAKDGLHPSGKQYKMWVDSFVDQVYQQFN